MDVETKAVGEVFAEVKAVKTSDPNGAFEAILSTGIVDRDGEIVDPGAFNPLPKSIPIHVNHQFMDVSKVVGRGEPFYDGDTLKVKGTFASTPDAQMVRTLVSEGMVQTMSVGFRVPTRDTKDGIPHVTAAELFEASFVSVPANTDALVTMAKAFDVDRVMVAIKALEDKIDALLSTKTPDADPDGKVVAPADTGATADPPLADVNVGMARLAAALAEAEVLLLP